MKNRIHCVEFHFKDLGDAITQISERNPLLFNSSGTTESFIFFDMIISSNGEIIEDRLNISPRYYFGKRVTKNEYVKLAAKTGRYDVNLLTNKKIDSVIVLETGEVILNPSYNSMTIEEYKESLCSKEEQTKIISFEDYKNRIKL